MRTYERSYKATYAMDGNPDTLGTLYFKAPNMEAAEKIAKERADFDDLDGGSGKLIKLEETFFGREKTYCPNCGKEYKERPALSRDDNKTEICPECGAREAMTAAGLKQSDIDDIIRMIQK